MKKIFLILFVITNAIVCQAQYYNAANGIAGGAPLLTALHNIIKGHSPIGYSGLWNAFAGSDSKPNGKVWDIYSYKFSGAQPYEYSHFSNQCGQYNNEGDCYNREHSWPQSYFNSADPMVSDLFHVYPTDGVVNGIRGNLPYGKVNNPDKTTLNGSKRGTSNTYPNNSDVFEPIDSFKGDLARTYFYMNTRYTTEGNSWQNWEMANGPELTQAAIVLLLSWHHLDPVSAKEIDRNNSVYTKQGNRNPFIDYPLYADCIWGQADCSALAVQNIASRIAMSVYPNPANTFLNVSLPFDAKQKDATAVILNMLGSEVAQIKNLDAAIDISNLNSGMYVLRVTTKEGVALKLFLKK